MKRVLSLCMCIFILTISLITYLPIISYAADNDFTLSIPSTADYFNIPASEVSSAISNRGDIYGSDHVLMWRYTPTDSYNWTSADKALWSYTHFSDSQLSAVMQSNNSVSALGAFFSASSSNNNIFSSLLSGAGALIAGDSDLFNSLYDKFTGNKNYLDAIEYDSQTGDFTLLADQVTALREELKSQYYETIGVAPLIFSGTDVKKAVTNLRDCFEFEEDYMDTMQRISDYDYSVSLKLSSCGFCFAFKRDSFNYCYFGSDNLFSLNFVDNDLNIIELPYVYLLNQEYIAGYNVYSFPNIVKYSTVSSTSNGNRRYFTLKNFAFNVHCNSDSTDHVELYKNIYGSFYNSSNSDFLIFNSYESLYNYVHGSQNAYLSSKVQEAGEDIKLSINDMNDNIASKIDDLIDSINNKKDGMSADELQDAIDKALDSISGKIDDIGDNTQQTNNKLDALLSLMNEQNNILLQILGVTEYIAYNTTKEDGSDYTTDDLKNTFNTMYDGVRNAILYGTNTVSDSGSTVSVAAYSSEDLATQDINNLDVHNGLFGKFPFSIPYQLYEWLQVLEAEPAAPTFNYNYGFMIFKKDDPDCNLTIDLSVYEPWANQAKSFERLFFTLLMAVFIYKKFKGNSLF